MLKETKCPRPRPECFEAERRGQKLDTKANILDIKLFLELHVIHNMLSCSTNVLKRYYFVMMKFKILSTFW